MPLLRNDLDETLLQAHDQEGQVKPAGKGPLRDKHHFLKAYIQRPVRMRVKVTSRFLVLLGNLQGL